MIAECNKDEFSDFNIQGYALLLITHLYRNYAYKTVDSDNRDNYSQKLINLNNCIKYIHNNYNKNISLQDVANIENLNKYYFCNIFKEFTGQTFKEYHNKLRITKAIEFFVPQIYQSSKLPFCAATTIRIILHASFAR